jgi:cytokinin riboside 5'-monophosphate phosphoribohydrolase
VRICVYCSSSDAVGEGYKGAADELGRLLAAGGHSLVFGGGCYGLMGAVARAARRGGARVTGVIPRFMAERTETEADEVVVTGDLRERKARMEELSDAFVALPGGFGTLEEILEILTLRQLGVVSKPAVFVNTNGFYAPLAAFFETLYRERFAKSVFRGIYTLSETPALALAYLAAWKAEALPGKWF